MIVARTAEEIWQDVKKVVFDTADAYEPRMKKKVKLQSPF